MASPEINELNLSFIYMVANKHILTDPLDKTMEDVLSEIDSHRLNSVAKNYSLFLKSHAPNITLHTSDEIIDFMAGDAIEGQLYGISIEDYSKIEIAGLSKWYDHILFLDVIRDGMRLIVPIYKLFSLKEDKLYFNAIGVTSEFVLNVEEDDKFLIASGTTLRVVLRQLKKQDQFKENISREHAGVINKFSIDQI